MTAALFVYMLMQPAFGALSDRIGRRRSMLCFGLFATLGTVLDELERTGLGTALVNLCVCAGMGTATIIERV